MGDDTLGSTGCKQKNVGTYNLVDFVKDFNHDYLEQVDVQKRNRHTWRSEVLTLDVAHESRIAKK